ncbi:hypothetical protein Tco_0939359 [Tanacetum coccineum]|uniref:Reverse transcriptase domain-containing protein n=1 Tax=Tanacetum coccineum TaxID=301880 RepID=A0ABQ5DQY9_9ASTR
MSDEPLGDDSKPISYDVAFSNSLFDLNDDYTLCYDNPVFDDEFEDIREHFDTLSTRDREIDFNPSRDIEELEHLLADDPVPVPRVFDDPLDFPLAFETKRLQDFKILQRMENDRVEYKIDAKRGVIPSDESKVHIEVFSVLWGNRLPIPDGSLSLSMYVAIWDVRGVSIMLLEGLERVFGLNYPACDESENGGKGEKDKQ